jgi:hypothetical protein
MTVPGSRRSENVPRLMKNAPRTTIAVSIIILLITLAVFSGVLKAGFVMWDDDIIIYDNPGLGGMSGERLWWAFTDIDSMMRYNPLTLLSWIITYQFFGLDPFWYHLGNWLLHAMSAVVLFLVLRDMVRLSVRPADKGTGGWRLETAAAVAALCWAVHPLRVEPVAWATDRTYCQAIFFLLVSTLCYLRAHGFSQAHTRRFNLLILLAVGCYLLSLLSYAIGISYIAIFFVLDIYLFKRIGGKAGWWRARQVKAVLLEKAMFAIPALAIGIVTVAVRVASAGVWEPPVPLSEFGLFPRVMQAAYIGVYFVCRPFWPAGLSPVYTTLVDFDPLSPLFVASAGGVANCGSACLRPLRCWRRTSRCYSRSWAFLSTPIIRRTGTHCCRRCAFRPASRSFWPRSITGDFSPGPSRSWWPSPGLWDG